MATIAEKIGLREELMEVETNPGTAWAHWMGEEMKDIHDDLWPAFLKDPFELLMRYRISISSRLQDAATKLLYH